MKKALKIAAQAEQSHAESASTFPLHRARLGLNKAGRFTLPCFHMRQPAGGWGEVFAAEVASRRVPHLHMFRHCLLCTHDDGRASGEEGKGLSQQRAAGA